MAVLSQRAYARHRGMALSAVQKAISSGRISTLPDGRIDPDAADREWEANTKARPPAVRRQPDDDQDAFGAAQYSKARAVREHYQARLAKIDYEERIGNLVSKDEVQVAAFNTHRVIRDAMLNIPDRVAAMLAAETDEAKCHEVLTTEIRKALNDFADALA
jgi:hypothetical protein